MTQSKYRRHPRVYQKQAEQKDDNSIVMSGAAAVGILALAFVKGIFWGYLIKKRCSK